MRSICFSFQNDYAYSSQLSGHEFEQTSGDGEGQVAVHGVAESDMT